MMKKNNSLTKFVMFVGLIVFLIGNYFYDWKFPEFSFSFIILVLCVFFIEIMNRLSSINDTLKKILEKLHEESIEK